MKRLHLVPLIAICCLLHCAECCADCIMLPRGILEIAESAFEGDTALTAIELPDGCRTIGDGAFSGCESLERVYIPASVESIGSDAFAGCRSDMLIKTTYGSAAQYYATRNNIDYQADTRYRALFLYQTHADDDDLRLVGPANDANVIKSCLRRFGTTTYAFDACGELSADGMLNAISDAFADAGAQDVSLLYFSGHGISSYDAEIRGALLGADGESYITAGQLRAALDKIAGRKLVIIDACYSGNLIDGDVSTSASAVEEALGYDAEAFIDEFISAFSMRTRRGIAGDSYFIITSAADSELSYEADVGAVKLGVFTNNLAEGCGYSARSGVYSDMKADVNANGVITVQEAYYYAWRKCVLKGQHVQVYPTDCDWFGFLRQ